MWMSSPHIPYRGALAHLTAPEIAAEILATPDSTGIQLTHEAEVYTFGAVLFAAWAGQWPRNYGRHPRDLSVHEIYAAVTNPATRRPIPGGWARMADLIRAMLETDAGMRPTVREVHTDLGQMVGGRL